MLKAAALHLIICSETGRRVCLRQCCQMHQGDDSQSEDDVDEAGPGRQRVSNCKRLNAPSKTDNESQKQMRATGARIVNWDSPLVLR